MLTENCAYKARCGRTGHFLGDDGKIHRCDCFIKDSLKREMGMFYREDIKTDSPFINLLGEDLAIVGDLNDFKKLGAPAILHAVKNKKTFAVWDAYRLVDIFLEKDTEENNFATATDVDLFILLLGIAKIANRRLPEMILQVLDRRSMWGKPTWVWVGTDLAQVGTEFSVELQLKLQSFQKVRIQC